MALVVDLVGVVVEVVGDAGARGVEDARGSEVSGKITQPESVPVPWYFSIGVEWVKFARPATTIGEW